MTDSTRRNTGPAPDQPVMGDHPELETDDNPPAESVETDGGRSRLVIPGIVVLVLVVIAIVLVVI